MLLQYHDARETLNGPNDIKGDGTSLQLMPATWNDSYRELERCLLKLRTDNPTIYAHLRERYLANQPFNETVKTVSVNERGNICLPANTQTLCILEHRKHTARVRLRRWHPWVRRDKVNEALDTLAANFRGEPWLAPELRSAAFAA